MKRALLALLALVVLAGGAAAAYVLYKRHESRNVRGSSTVEFVTTQTAPARPPSELSRVPWPTYGYDAERGRFAPGIDLRPPYSRLWMFRARNLVEFPPVVAYRRLFFANNSGVFYAVSASTGKRAWRFVSGRCVAASPAVFHNVVFQTFLNRPPCNSSRVTDGEVIAFGAGSGRIVWRTRIGPSESSPLVANGYVYVGDWRGKVYALHRRTGVVAWSFQTGDRVKGAAALSGGRLFVGSYDSHVYALDAKTGKLIWRASSQDRLGGRGTFYSTPAVAYGRVYIGSTDGKVYSFGATSGKLRWSRGTGGYVYSSPAVWRRRVLIGSYDGTFYALDAATGDVLWRFEANGPISGAATVLGGVVYFATLKERTYALDAVTGKLLWSFPDGKYSPVVADAKRLYLVGYARVYGLRERGRVTG